MSYVTLPPNEPPADFPTDLAISYTFPLDNWQKHAIAAIHRGENVLVTAKTGSGKTLVGEYQIAYSIAKGQRVFYTTPIKSLSNQKYHDLKHLFPAASVGLLTGDIKCAPESQIVVMTTEIFRNLLFKDKTTTATVGTAGHLTMKDLGAVVFDEVHYINDADRGHVWEESLILMPPEVRAILLSATMEAPVAFAEWMGAIHRHPITLLQTKHRVVPLTHAICVPDDARFFVPFKAGDEAPFQAAVYYDYLKAREAEVKGAEGWARRVHAAHAAGDSAGGLAGKVKLHAFPHTLNKAVEKLQSRNLLPALFFVFSRKECERYAELVAPTLIDGGEIGEVRKQIAFHLAPHRAVLEPLAQYHQILKLLDKGIAFHHSGLLPLLKEIVELLFARGFIKVLFCTETFAVGLNMPARTVVFLDLVKPSEHGLRPLRPEEYIQMAGRAGRRGKDTQGTVLYLPARTPVEPDELRGILCGGLAPMTSRMAFHYDFALKALHKSAELTATLLSNSYGTGQRERRKAALEPRIAALEAQIAALGVTGELKAAAEQKAMLENQIRVTRNAPQRRARDALATWTAKYGATWSQVRLDQERVLAKELEEMKMDVGNLTAENDVRRFEPVLRALQSGGYATAENTLTTYTLTNLGILATECNEANPLLLSRLYTSGLLKGGRIEEIVGVLAAFITDREAYHGKDLAVSGLVKSTLATLDTWSQEGLARDDCHFVTSPVEYWNLTTMWVDVVTLWLGGTSATEICRYFEIYEGNLMKGLLKVNNIVREWVSLATIQADVEMLLIMEGIEGKLLHGLATPESLYLRL